jgi:hypothetical protein
MFFDLGSFGKKHFCETRLDPAQNFQQRTSQRTSPDWQSVTKADPASAAGC